MSDGTTRGATPADRVVLTNRPDGESPDWAGEALSKPAYRRYLGRARAGPVTVGDEWTEFLNCGCGTRADVTLRVEAVEGGDAIGPETRLAFEPAADGE